MHAYMSTRVECGICTVEHIYFHRHLFCVFFFLHLFDELMLLSAIRMDSTEKNSKNIISDVQMSMHRFALHSSCLIIIIRQFVCFFFSCCFLFAFFNHFHSISGLHYYVYFLCLWHFCSSYLYRHKCTLYVQTHSNKQTPTQRCAAHGLVSKLYVQNYQRMVSDYMNHVCNYSERIMKINKKD